jgi:O-methyltransferase
VKGACRHLAEAVARLLRETGGVNGVRVVRGVFPDESGETIERERFRFLHIHVDVYDSVRDVTCWVWERLVPGGIIVYGDYGFQGCDGVTLFIEKEMAGAADRVVMGNLNGHAVVVKTG